jgi:hypothetical protein
MQAIGVSFVGVVVRATSYLLNIACQPPVRKEKLLGSRWKCGAKVNPFVAREQPAVIRQPAPFSMYSTQSMVRGVPGLGCRVFQCIPHFEQ